jgi:hypothetical protein
LKDQKNTKYCFEYSRIAAEEANSFFKSIKSNEISENYFHLLEHFYCALEETSFPPPENFFEHFTMVGYRVLNPMLFVQYIQRSTGIVLISFFRYFPCHRIFD